VPTRLHRANLILDVFGGAKAVRKTLERFKAEGRGVLVMLRDGAAGVPVVTIPKSDETASGEARNRPGSASRSSVRSGLRCKHTPHRAARIGS
jgi:hypothetical protein